MLSMLLDLKESSQYVGATKEVCGRVSGKV